jgi:hypothetical protein
VTEKSGHDRFVCVDFTDQKTGEKVNLDFDTDGSEGNLRVTDVWIHEVNGLARIRNGEKSNPIEFTPFLKEHITASE